MTLLFTVNQSPLNGADTMFRFKTAIKAAGATIVNSSDGTTYNASGDQITTFSTGAGGLANTNAWFTFRLPDGRQFNVQRTTANTIYRIKYSKSAGFTGGTPGATRVPSATDEGVLYGSGTDASPTGQVFFGTDASYYTQIMCNNASPYEFYFICYPIGGSTTNLVVFLFDPLNNTDSLDTDPTVSYVAGTALSNVLQLGSLSSSSGPLGWLKLGMVGASYVRIPALYYTSSGGGQTCPSNMPSNPHSGLDDELPMPYGRSTSMGAPVGWKGVSRLMRWRGLDRAVGSTIDLAPGTKNRLVIGNVSLPWDGTTTPSV